MLDETEQLQRYAAALGDAVPEKPADRDTRSSRRLVMAAAAVVVVAAGVWALMETMVDGDESPVATQAGQGQISVPVDGASPELLDDGTPVWVVRHDAGTVSVLDAVSTHRPFGAGNMVGWCESSQGFVDPMYGSVYDERGRKQGGPAPRGLDAYPVTVDGDTATVTGPPSAQPRAADGGPEAAKPAGPHCLEQAEGDDAATLRLHPLASATPTTPTEAVRGEQNRVVLIDAPVVLVRGQTAVVCTTGVEYSQPPRCDGVPAPSLELPPDTPWAVMTGTFIARSADGKLTELAYVGERQVDRPAR